MNEQEEREDNGRKCRNYRAGSAIRRASEDHFDVVPSGRQLQLDLAAICGLVLKASAIDKNLPGGIVIEFEHRCCRDGGINLQAFFFFRPAQDLCSIGRAGNLALQIDQRRLWQRYGVGGRCTSCGKYSLAPR